jgi:hypothetical protein
MPTCFYTGVETDRDIKSPFFGNREHLVAKSSPLFPFARAKRENVIHACSYANTCVGSMPLFAKLICYEEFSLIRASLEPDQILRPFFEITRMVAHSVGFDFFENKYSAEHIAADIAVIKGFELFELPEELN